MARVKKKGEEVGLVFAGRVLERGEGVGAAFCGDGASVLRRRRRRSRRVGMKVLFSPSARSGGRGELGKEGWVNGGEVKGILI